MEYLDGLVVIKPGRVERHNDGENSEPLGLYGYLSVPPKNHDYLF
jgi:hypothetical protein